MKTHPQLRGNTYYARLVVPQDLRHIYGKTELLQSLQTSSQRQAEIRNAKVVAEWKLEFAKFRNSEDEWLVAAKTIKLDSDVGETPTGAPLSGRDAYIEHVAEGLSEDDERKFRAVINGRTTPFAFFVDEFLAQWAVQDKTKAMARTAIDRVASKLPNLEDATWYRVTQLVASDSTSPKTKAKNYGFVSKYWKFLENCEVVARGNNPFSGRDFRSPVNHQGTVKRLPFTVDEVVRLRLAAQEGDDESLVSLIELAAYTGARIEELCSLRVADVITVDECECISIVDAKTPAGVRIIPVHAQVRERLSELMSASDDGYVLSGLTFNKYGDRSNAIGKRFGRLKSQLGFGRPHVFHSIRKTVVTMLEDKGVSEGLTADIVGHEKDTMTYGLYSGGHSVHSKMQALSHLDFPF